MTPQKKVRVSDAKVLEAKNKFRGPKKTLLAGLALMDSEPHSRLLHIEFSFILMIQHYFMLHKNVMQIYKFICQKNIRTQHSLETPHSAPQKVLLLCFAF